MTAIAPRLGAGPLLRVLLVTTALLFAALTVFAGPASAHAAMTGSTPGDGAVVATAPKDIALTFSEQVALGKDSIRVLDPANKRADSGKIRDLSSGGTVRYGVDLRPGLPDGTYTVAWQAVSADSHPVSGAFTFSIGAASKTTATVSGDEVGGGLVGGLYGAASYASYAGFILLVGGAAFVLGCWPRGATVRSVQRLIVQGWVTLTAATLALLLLRTPYTGSGKLLDAFDLHGLRDVLATKPGAALISRLLLLGAAALFVAVLFGAYAKRDAPRDAKEGRVRRDLTFGLGVGGSVIAAGIAATWALTEHASTGVQPGLAMPLDILHLLAVATWLGGLSALLVALYRAPRIESTAVLRFSRAAFTSVVVLAATGLYQAWRQVGSWSALFGTTYGQLLLVKVGLVAVLVCIAWFSRRWTRRLGERAQVAAEAFAGPRPEALTADGSAETAEVTAGSVTALAGAGKSGRQAGVGDDSGSTERMTQLARQKAALATARRKRLRNADASQSGLRRSVLAETGVAVVLLAVTTVLTTTEPGRTDQLEATKSTGAAAGPVVPGGPVDVSLPFDTGGPKGKGVVEVSVEPGRTGVANLVHIYVNGSDGRPLDVPELKAALTLKAKKIGPLPITLQHFAFGHWAGENLRIPMAGTWQLRMTVRTSDIDETTVVKNVRIG